MDLAAALIFAIGLLTLINPTSILPAYTEIVSHYSSELQSRIALRTTWALMIIMLVVIWLGQHLLSVLDLSIGSLQVAGGIILLRGALRMVDANDKQLPDDEKRQTAAESWQVMAVVPLATPLSVGGGAIAFIIATASQYNTAVDLLILSVVAIIVAIIVGSFYYFSTPIKQILGPIGMRILVRIRRHYFAGHFNPVNDQRYHPAAAGLGEWGITLMTCQYGAG